MNNWTGKVFSVKGFSTQELYLIVGESEFELSILIYGGMINSHHSKSFAEESFNFGDWILEYD